jgi:nucleosome-remodeling factor subunit
MAVKTYTAIERGIPNTDSYQVFIKDSAGCISPFHDIPLVANAEAKTYNAVIEVPRWTNAKMEIDTKSPLNPIIQDKKKGKLRYVANSFPHHGYIWNYGCLPQTWENPNHTDESTGCKGDNDPVDVCEIGHRVCERGDVIEVKLLGTLAMIDDGETDWKMMVIDINDPLAASLSSLDDVEKAMPGFLQATREWFRIYKMPDGKPENKFAFDGEYQNVEFSHKIVEETHGFWKKLVGIGEVEDAGKLSPKNVTVEGSQFPLSREEAEGIFNQSDEPAPGPAIDNSVDLWHYIHLK